MRRETNSGKPIDGETPGGAPRLPRLWFLRALIAAVPGGLLAVVYGMAAFSGKAPLGISTGWLQSLTFIEILAIHSFPFITLLALFRPPQPEIGALKWLLTAGLVFMYVNASFQSAGWAGVCALISLVGATYLGFFLNWQSSGSMIRLGLRWVTNVILFMLSAAVAGMPPEADNWVADPRALSLGALYFSLSTIVELTGLYQLNVYARWGARVDLTQKGLLGKTCTDPIHLRLWRAIWPIASALLWCGIPLVIGPLLTIGFAKLVDGQLEGLSKYSFMRDGMVVVMTGVLLSGRGLQWYSICKGLGSTERWRWWRSWQWLLGLLVLTTAYGVAGMSFYGDSPASLRYASIFSRAPLEHYAAVESLSLLVMLPLTWASVVRKQWRRERLRRRPSSPIRVVGGVASLAR